MSGSWRHRQHGIEERGDAASAGFAPRGPVQWHCGPPGRLGGLALAGRRDAGEGPLAQAECAWTGLRSMYAFPSSLFAIYVFLMDY